MFKPAHSRRINAYFNTQSPRAKRAAGAVEEQSSRKRVRGNARLQREGHAGSIRRGGWHLLPPPRDLKLDRWRLALSSTRWICQLGSADHPLSHLGDRIFFPRCAALNRQRGSAYHVGLGCLEHVSWLPPGRSGIVRGTCCPILLPARAAPWPARSSRGPMTPSGWKSHLLIERHSTEI